MESNIIDSSDSGIVITETRVTISDEKLNSMLIKAYEAAQRDAHAFQLHDLWSVCLSIAFTLIIAILTSTFNPIGTLDASVVRTLAIAICAFFSFAGIVLAIWRIRNKSYNDTIARDNAVKEIAETYILKQKKA